MQLVCRWQILSSDLPDPNPHPLMPLGSVCSASVDSANVGQQAFGKKFQKAPESRTWMFHALSMALNARE